MIGYKVTGDIDAVRRLFKNIPDKVTTPAANAAINSAAVTVRQEAITLVAKETGFRIAKLREKTDIKKSTFQSMTARITIKRISSNLIEFVQPGKQFYGAFRKKPGVTHKAWNRRVQVAGSFIAQGASSGKALVYKRTGPHRTAKLKALYGPHNVKAFLMTTIRTQIDATAKRTFLKRFEHEAKRRLAAIQS